MKRYGLFVGCLFLLVSCSGQRFSARSVDTRAVYEREKHTSDSLLSKAVYELQTRLEGQFAGRLCWVRFDTTSELDSTGSYPVVERLEARIEGAKKEATTVSHSSAQSLTHRSEEADRGTVVDTRDEYSDTRWNSFGIDLGLAVFGVLVVGYCVKRYML